MQPFSQFGPDYFAMCPHELLDLFAGGDRSPRLLEAMRQACERGDMVPVEVHQAFGAQDFVFAVNCKHPTAP